MQIKRLLWTLLALTVAWFIALKIGDALDFTYLVTGGGGPSREGWGFRFHFQELLFVILFIAWLVTIYKHLSAPKG